MLISYIQGVWLKCFAIIYTLFLKDVLKEIVLSVKVTFR